MAARGSDDILSIIQASARSGTLLSSCQPEVKELMHQLDVLISARCGEWKGEVDKLQALLDKKDDELHVLQATLAEKESEVEQVKGKAGSREREYRARCADYEAQLVRLRSQVTRISQSYEQLRDKRQQQTRGGSRVNSKGLESTAKILELKEEVDRAKCAAHVANTELKRALERIERLEAEQRKQQQPWLGAGQNAALTEHMLEELKSRVEESVIVKEGSDYTSLQLTPPLQETDQLLQQLLDTHFQQLKLELQTKSGT